LTLIMTNQNIPQQPNWENFTPTPTKADVLSYLQETGWEIKKSTFYDQHCAKGKLTKNRAGVYTKRAVKKYAETWLTHGGLGSTVAVDEENLSRQKLVAEISRIKTAEDRDRFKLDVEKKRYIERDRMEQELAARAVVIDQGLEFFFRAKVDEMVALVGGVPDKAPLLLEMCIKEKDKQINQFARMDNFTIIIEDDD